MMSEIFSPARAARALADQLQRDILSAANRIDHTRLTARAIEAEHLARQLEQLADDGK
jgi:hypothetical protein